MNLLTIRKGMSLGKSNEGITEPIGIVMRQGKAGLGVLEEKIRKEEEGKVKKIEMNEKLISNFSERMSDKFNSRKWYAIRRVLFILGLDN